MVDTSTSALQSALSRVLSEGQPDSQGMGKQAEPYYVGHGAGRLDFLLCGFR